MVFLVGYSSVSQCAEEIASALGNIQPTSGIAPVANGKKVYVVKIQVRNARLLAAEDIFTIVAPFENRELDFAQIQAVSILLVEAYRQRGYPVAQAYVPVQDIPGQNGVLFIDVVEGTFGKIQLNNASLNRTAWLQDRVDALTGTVISNDALERQLRLLNETPGTAVESANLSAGAASGSSDLFLALTSPARVSMSTQIDNQGSVYTGKQRLSAALEIHAPLGYGDKLSVDAMGSEAGRLLNGRIGYALPLGTSGLKAEIASSKTTYALGGEFSSLDAVGSANASEASLLYPLQKSASNSLDVRLTLSDKRMQDEVRATATTTSKSAEVAVLALTSTRESPWWGMAGATQVEIAYTQGSLHLQGDALAADQAAGGANTHGNYAKLNLFMARSMRMTHAVSGTFSMRAQQALGNKNLDGSEDFTVSGPSGVKAYSSGELSAENGYLVGVEMAFAMPTVNNVQWSVLAFANHGRAYMQNPVAGSEDRALGDVGVGLIAQNARFFSKLQLAMATAQEPSSESTARTKVLWQIGMRF